MDTRKIITGMANGKTTELIKISSKTRQYIICKDRMRAKYIIKIAKELGLNIPHPITAEQLPLGSKYIYKVLVDDVLDVLEVFIGKGISEATTRAQHIEIQDMGNISDAEIDSFGKFSDDEKKIIKEQYSRFPKGYFPNPRCALY